MKRFFIVDINEEGTALGFATDNLYKDFIEQYKITWDEVNSGDAFSAPVIENLKVGKGYRVIYIFDMSQGYQHMDKGPEYKSGIGEFNLFTEDFYDDLIDFIQQYWRIIERGMDESNSVKKFKDFK
jgi:hypothetical protein